MGSNISGTRDLHYTVIRLRFLKKWEERQIKKYMNEERSNSNKVRIAMDQRRSFEREEALRAQKRVEGVKRILPTP